MAGGNRGDDGREWTREPPDRTRGPHRRHQPVGSGAERQRYRAAPIARSHDPAVGHESAASPNEGGTAEGTTFRPGTIRSFLILEANAMSTADPISLAQAKRLAANADTILLRATRPADLETPDRRVPAPRRRRPGLPPRVRRGRRAPRPLLVPRRRPAPAARGPRRPGPHPDPAGHRADLRPGPADPHGRRRPTRSTRSARSSRAAASSRPRACRASPAAPSARSPTTRSRCSSRRCRCPSAIRSASRRPPSSRPISSSSSTT